MTGGWGFVPSPSESGARYQAFKSLKTYRNERHGFEIDIPHEWKPVPGMATQGLAILSGASGAIGKDSFQYGCREEAMNFVIGPLSFVPDLEDTERAFSLYARGNGWTHLQFGRIVVGGIDHVWASYRIHDRFGERWNKKYTLVFGHMQYALTYTCDEPTWCLKRERDIDATVASFRLLQPIVKPSKRARLFPPPEVPRPALFDLRAARRADVIDLLSFSGALGMFAVMGVGMLTGRAFLRVSLGSLLLMTLPAVILVFMGPKLGFSRRLSIGMAIVLYVAYIGILVWTN
jgi:hypothetical protein